MGFGQGLGKGFGQGFGQGLGSCYSCIKYLMFTFNFLFWVSTIVPGTVLPTCEMYAWIWNWYTFSPRWRCNAGVDHSVCPVSITISMRGYRLTAPLFIRPFRLTAPLFIRLMDAPPHFKTAPLDSPPHFRTAPLDSPPYFKTAPLDSPPFTVSI